MKTSIGDKATIVCPTIIPDPCTAKTPTQRRGLENAHRFKDFVDVGLKAGTLPTHNGHLNCKAIATLLNFGRSGYSTNRYICAIVLWAEKEMGLKRGYTLSGKVPREGDPENEIQKLKTRLAQVVASLVEADARLLEFRYLERGFANGQVRLPW